MVEIHATSLARRSDVSPIPALMGGSLWYTGFPRTALSQNGRLGFTVQNPANSGVTVLITQLAMYSSAALYFEFHLDPTTNLPTTLLEVANGIFDNRTYGGATIARAEVAVAEMSGGNELPLGLGTGAGAMTFSTSPVALPPGHMIGLHTLAASNTDVAMTVSFTEL
jgi:hypothetical protein